MARTERKSISKKLRFEIFKRDNFCCQYCSAKPPKVPLEIDHIIPVSKGGGNKIENLITACFNCNRGKSNNELTCVAPNTQERTERMKIAQDQYKQYKKILAKEKNQIEADINQVQEIYSACFDDWVFTDRFRLSVKKFIATIGVNETIESMERSCSKIYDKQDVLKYFCGICWAKIREGHK